MPDESMDELPVGPCDLDLTYLSTSVSDIDRREIRLYISRVCPRALEYCECIGELQRIVAVDYTQTKHFGSATPGDSEYLDVFFLLIISRIFLLRRVKRMFNTNGFFFLQSYNISTVE